MSGKTAFVRHWQNRIGAVNEVLAGLAGRPFSWNSGGLVTRDNLEELGIKLVTRSWLDKRGYELVRGAKPVGSIYFPAPISDRCDVFVLECQARLVRPDKLAKVEAQEKERKA